MIYRYCLIKDASIYGIANIGPMYLPIETERQVKGLTFSDIFGIGLNYKINKFSLDFRGSIRHVSNAYIKTPNAGYNSIGLEVGVFYEL